VSFFFSMYEHRKKNNKCCATTTLKSIWHLLPYHYFPVEDDQMLNLWIFIVTLHPQLFSFPTCIRRSCRDNKKIPSNNNNNNNNIFTHTHTHTHIKAYWASQPSYPLFSIVFFFFLLFYFLHGSAQPLSSTKLG
jgi:hypothetical protein